MRFSSSSAGCAITLALCLASRIDHAAAAEPFCVQEIWSDTNGVITVAFPTDTNHLYAVEALAGLTAPVPPLVAGTMLGQPARTVWTDPAPVTGTPRYYRVRQLEFEADSDADTLSNRTEFDLGTNLLAADTDGDGLPDGWEVRYALDPLSALGDHGATGDPDQDGADNLTEHRQGRNPRAGVIVDGGEVIGLEVFTPWD